MAKNARNGFTMIEMAISLVIVSVIILAVAGVIANSHNIWGRMYQTVFGDDAQDLINLQRAYNRTCRKSTLRDVMFSDDGQAMRLYYFSNHLNPSYWPDRYSTFYLDGSDLMVEHGTLQFASLVKNETLYTQRLCSDVEYLQFAAYGLSVQMCMKRNNNGKINTFTWASVRHN